MLLRIHVDAREDRTALHVLGRLDGDGVWELARVYEECDRPVVLDLADLRSVDDVGAAYLQGLVDAGVLVTGMNPYVTALLRLDEEGRRIGRSRPEV